MIRLFFRTLGKLLTPFIVLYEKLATAQTMHHANEARPALDDAAAKLALYQFQHCPFCVRVRREISRLGITVELRDAQHDPEHRTALAVGGGRVTVPCLRITHDDGDDEWLYESADINAWLRKRFEQNPGEDQGN